MKERRFIKKIVRVSKNIGNQLKDNPISTAMLAVSTTNLALSRQNERRNKESNEVQAKILNSLNRTLNKVDKTMKTEQSKSKHFSIESGNYTGNRRSPINIGKSTLIGTGVGAGVGALYLGGAHSQGKLGAIIGGSIGAFTGLMTAIADKSSFNSRGPIGSSVKPIDLIQLLESYYTGDYEETVQETTTTKISEDQSVNRSVTRRGREKVSPKGIVYEIDGNQKKYVVSALIKNKVLILYINNPDKYELQELNEVLDNYCYRYKYADYISTPIDKNSYIVEVNLVGENEALGIIVNILENIKVNVLTGGRVSERKTFSIRSRAIEGAITGASLGTGTSMFLPKKLPFLSKGKEVEGKFVTNERNIKFNKKIEGYNKTDKSLKKLAVITTTTLIGAALGAIVGAAEELNKKFVSKIEVNNNLLSGIVSDLKKSSFKEGTHFTRDPKRADELRTKVCIVITRNSGDLRVLINTQSDSKLENLVKTVTKNIPNSSVQNTSTSSKYNEISITTISDGSADVGLISGICNQFIRSGYPIYLIEVG